MQDCLKLIESVGVDEVGRGPLAGPVVAACVYTPEFVDFSPGLPKIRDSKKMTHISRMKVVDWLHSQNDIKYAIAFASVQEIDDLNILQATFLAMKRAITALKGQIAVDSIPVYIDGNRLPDFSAQNMQCIVGGDNKIISIALASIIAKEYRDSLMRKLDEKYPQYGFAKNVGYGTKQHISAIYKYGITEQHRKSFEPVKSKIAQNVLYDIEI